MDFIFWLAIINNIFSIFGFTGVVNQQKELVTGFFAYNAVQMIVAFHYFVDVCADVGIRWGSTVVQLGSKAVLSAGHGVLLHFRVTANALHSPFAVSSLSSVSRNVLPKCRYSGEPAGLTSFERAAAGMQKHIYYLDNGLCVCKKRVADADDYSQYTHEWRMGSSSACCTCQLAQL